MLKLRYLFILYILLNSLVSLGFDKQLLASDTLKMRGDGYFSAGAFPEALDNYRTALDIARADKDESMQVRLAGSIGNVYASIGDYQRAINYYLDGYSRAEKLGESELQFKFATNLVAAYSFLGMIQDAKVFYRVQSQLPSFNNNLKQYYLLHNQSVISHAEGDIDMALHYGQKALVFADQRRLPPVLRYTELVQLARMEIKKDNLDKALEMLCLANQMSTDSIGLQHQAELHQVIAEVYSLQEMRDSAALHTSIYEALSDSVFNQKQIYLASNRLFDSENQHAQQRIAYLVNNSRRLWGVILAFVVLVGVIAYLLWRLWMRNRDLHTAYAALIEKQQEIMVGASEKAPSIRTRTLDDNQARSLFEKIDAAFNNPAVFCKTDFSLEALAETVDSNSNYVSKVINEVYGQNFRSVLNRQRVREAVRRMSDHQNYNNVTLQGIYQECGFTSASTFIQAFKREHGMTPSTYLKLSHQESSPTAHQSFTASQSQEIKAL